MRPGRVADERRGELTAEAGAVDLLQMLAGGDDAAVARTACVVLLNYGIEEGT